MPLPRLAYNSPVVLTIALAAIALHLVDAATPGTLTTSWFSLPGRFHWQQIGDWFRMVSYPIGHADWAHLVGNLTLWLVLGPLIEEKYGTATLLEMVLITTVVTAVLNMTFFHTGLLGMSGLVFMLIILSSVTNFKAGQIPLTFLLVAGLFLGKEIVEAFQADRISQFAHILGGICGSLFGFAGKK
jgi:membrane associated rhomboid family serine protease